MDIMKNHTIKVSTQDLKKGDLFLTKGVNLDSPFDPILMAICTKSTSKSIEWRSFSPRPCEMKITGYTRKGKQHFEVEKVIGEVDPERWLSLVKLDPLFL